MIRLVVTDLDGTLWGPDLVVPVAHRAAIAELTASGIDVIVATARRQRVVAAAFAGVSMSPSAVVLDGAMGVDLDTGVRFHESPFPTAAALAVLAVFARFDLDPCVYIDDPHLDVVLSSTPSTCVDHVAELGDIARTGDLDDTVAFLPVHQFAILGLAHERLAPVAAALQVTGAEVVVHRERRFEGWGIVVGPPAVTKWNGVLAYCERAGISPDSVLAVGDGDNDVDMLQRAAVAVAVRGGTERAVAAAGHIIEPPEQNGWAAILDLVRPA